MLERAEEMQEVLDLRPSRYFADDQIGRLARKALRSDVYEFCDAGNELGKAFRSANPRVDLDPVREMRYNLAHEYPNVTPEALLAFAQEIVPRVIRGLRRAHFPKD